MRQTIKSNKFEINNSTSFMEEKQREYNYVVPWKKRMFLKLIFNDRLKIIKASQMLGINYSTAKSIVRVHRMKFGRGKIESAPEDSWNFLKPNSSEPVLQT